MGARTAVYASNLPIPLLFAWGLTEKAGRVGVTLAILLSLSVGALAVSRFRAAGLAVIIGGIIVSPSQLFPMLQVIAGGIGMSAALGNGKSHDQASTARWAGSSPRW